MPKGDVPPQITPKTNNDYFEVVTQAVFQSGFRWSVVRAKWPGFKKAFKNFSINQVAKFDESDIDRLVEDKQIVRNGLKIKATIANAKICQEIIKESGSIKKYLQSLQKLDYKDRSKQVSDKFKFMGPLGAYFFLWTVREPVPSHEEYTKLYKSKKL